MSMISFDVTFICGLMFGIEHVDIDDGEWAIVIDVGFIRFMLIKETITE